MKIDYGNITHNVFRLIGEATSEVYDFLDNSEQSDHLRIETLGEIRGILNMAEAMINVLKQ